MRLFFFFDFEAYLLPNWIILQSQSQIILLEDLKTFYIHKAEYQEY